ncbi:MAG TPA: energy transducer TonB [Terriglobales bacterium]|jgi:TonB family protein
MKTDPAVGLFSLLPEKRPPWKEFSVSMITQGLALVLLCWVGVLHPEVLEPVRDSHLVFLVSTPPPINHEPAPIQVFHPKVEQLPVPSHEAFRVPVDMHVKVRREQPLAAPKVVIAASKPPELEPATPVIPRRLVQTNVFSSGISQQPTIARAPEKVQTGGLGDPNGVAARENYGKPVTIAAMGAFDAPAGPGRGNGTGGATGAAGVVASAGFGNATAIGDGSGRANYTRGNGAVREAGFGDAEAVATGPAKNKIEESTLARLVPAEITSKPTPAYTEEARKLRIEGEVLLQVVFESSGKLRVVRVVRGLGHGLDDSAVRAAEQIRFKPALREGQPADSTAILHIIFQLA